MIFGCTRHSLNKFGSALVGTKILRSTILKQAFIVLDLSKMLAYYFLLYLQFCLALYSNRSRTITKSSNFLQYWEAKGSGNCCRMEAFIMFDIASLRIALSKSLNVNHQYSVPTIFQWVNRISILNKGCTYMMPCSMFIPHTNPS